MSEQKPKEKILDRPFFSSLIIPIAVVALGALIVFGVGRMLTVERSYRDLVEELGSKTFGNRWVAAYELAKFFKTSSIPEEDLPWVIGELTRVYQGSTNDARTRNFIVLALGTLDSGDLTDFFNKALKDPSSDIVVSVLAVAGNKSKEQLLGFNWSDVAAQLGSKDSGVKQAAMLCLAQHNITDYKEQSAYLLKDEERQVRYSAATALIAFQDERALPLIREIFETPSEKEVRGKVDREAQFFVQTKLNMLEAIGRYKWIESLSFLENVVQQETHLTVQTKATEILNLLKN